MPAGCDSGYPLAREFITCALLAAEHISLRSKAMSCMVATNDADARKGLPPAQSKSDSPQARWGRAELTCKVLGRRVRPTTCTWNADSGTAVLTEDLKLVSDPLLFGRHIAELNASDNALVRTYVWGLHLSGTEQGAGGVGGLLWLTSFQLRAPSSERLAPCSTPDAPRPMLSRRTAYASRSGRRQPLRGSDWAAVACLLSKAQLACW